MYIVTLAASKNQVILSLAEFEFLANFAGNVVVSFAGLFDSVVYCSSIEA